MSTHLEPKPAGTPTWVELMTPEPEAARSFYGTVLGWEYNIGAPEYGGYTTAVLGDRSVAGLAGPQPDAPPAPVAWSLYFASEDLEGDVARAEQLGASVHVPPMTVGAFGSMAICEDPTGAAFGFWKAGEHVGAQAIDERGAACWYELSSSNAQQARDFYAALLGATVEPMPGDLEYYVLKHGEKELVGVMQSDPAWGDIGPQWLTYFGVPDADAAVAMVTGNGGEVLGSIDDSPFGRLATLKDPHGALFKIIEVQAD